MSLAPMHIGGVTFDFSRPYIVGILNVTPDSFSDGGAFFDAEKALKRGLAMVGEGADMIDVGGESTRPGSMSVDADEEKRRVVPVIGMLRQNAGIPISVDTTKAEVAEAALAEGANVINDVSGLRFDPELAAVAAQASVPLILMHSRKTPSNMQEDIRYDDFYGDVAAELQASMAEAARRGVDESNVILDPGIGFAKTIEHNLMVLSNLGFLARLGRPVMVGPSRKSFIGKVTGADVNDRMGGTAAAVAAAVMAGANFLRVHDVGIMKQTARIAFSIKQCHTGKNTEGAGA
jgi:dihydropteroate synthase